MVLESLGDLCFGVEGVLGRQPSKAGGTLYPNPGPAPQPHLPVRTTLFVTFYSSGIVAES